jgi:predicted TIM-barrel fold metal-dependent hydrolase
MGDLAAILANGLKCNYSIYLAGAGTRLLTRAGTQMPPREAIGQTLQFVATKNVSYAGVDHCILQTGWGYGAMNDYNAFAQNQYPNKFTALLNVDEPRAVADAGLAEFDRAHRDLGLKGVYFALDAFARYGFDVTFDDARYDTCWSKIDAAGLPVFFEITAIPDYDAASYISNLVRLHGLMDRYTNIRWVLVMGPPSDSSANRARGISQTRCSPPCGTTVCLSKSCSPITWGGAWEYPYPQAQELVRGMRDLFDASKLVWGSDMPNVERFCTYTQSLPLRPPSLQLPEL